MILSGISTILSGIFWIFVGANIKNNYADIHSGLTSRNPYDILVGEI